MSAARLGALKRDDGSSALGTWIKIAAPEVVEIAAFAGFDFVVIDLEHTLLGAETVSTMIGVARMAGLAPLVRTPDHGQSMMQRVLDAGAAGLLVPQVNTVQEARDIVRNAKFPPIGTRGLSTSGRAGHWGAMPPKEYMTAGDDDCVIIVQLETEPAVRDAVTIAAHPGIDAVFVGPMDLAVSMGVDTCSPSFLNLVTQLERECASAGIVLGTACPDGAQAKELLARGYRLLVLSNDAAMLRIGATALVNSARTSSEGMQP